MGRLRGEGAEAEGVHDGERAGVHGEDIAEDAADAGSGALIGLDVGGVVVGLDFEGAGPAVAHVDDAGVLPGALDDGAGTAGAFAASGEPLEVDAGALVGAVLGPHDGEDAELGKGRGAAEFGAEAGVLLVGDGVRFEQGRGDHAGGRNPVGGGGWKVWLGCGLGHGWLPRLSHAG